MCISWPQWLSGLALLGLSIAFARDHTRERARRLFYGSLLYLPVLWVVLIGSKSDVDADGGADVFGLRSPVFGYEPNRSFVICVRVIARIADARVVLTLTSRR